MGFTDNNHNLELLKKFKGDENMVAIELLNKKN